MKKIISLFAAGSVAAGSAYAGLAPGDVAGNFIAGWDFAEVTNITSDADSYGSDVAGASSSGTLYMDGTAGSSDIAPLSEAGTNNVQFNSFGRGVSSTSFRGQNGFDTTTTRGIGDTATGQQALQFNETTSAFSFVISLDTLVDDALIEFDWMMDGQSFADALSDFLDIAYSTDGGSSYTSFEPNASGDTAGADFYAAAGADESWNEATTGGGIYALQSGQDDAVIDFTGISGVDAIRFDVAAGNGSDSIYFDNIAVTGTAVPEPSAFAAIAGALALGFAAVRRRRS